MKLAVNPDFPDSDEDRELLHQLRDIPVRPVFVMGLHRSGTTFLYDCIARSFPVAQLTLYHLFYFHRLLSNAARGDDQRDKDRLNACFKSLGIENRNIDSVAVNADEVEEYGFLLRQFSGRFAITDSNVALFELLCKKLVALSPEAQAVILKNPWDTGNAENILRYFPEARFIYISREPISILSSLLNAMLVYLKGPQYYLELLLGRGKSRKGYRAGYAAWQVLRLVRWVLGEAGISRLIRPLLAKEVAAQVARYRREIAALPADRAVEVDYRELIESPEAVMQSLQAFLDLPLSIPVSGFEVRERRQGNPALDSYQAKLEMLISAATDSVTD